MGESRRPVPPPWTPVSVEGAAVSCWGRKHLVRGALPAQIHSQGQALLSAPVSLRRDGTPLTAWKRSAVTRDGRRAAWTASARPPVPAGGQQPVARLRTSVAYDGFWQVDLELGAGAVRQLSLEIPLAARHARYLHFVNETHYQEPNTLQLPPGEGEIWSSRFACTAWLGDERVGLAWCADSDAPFRLRQPERALTLRRAGATVTLRITLIDYPVRLAKPLTWRFGLIATPVRPIPAGWRDWRLAPGETANHHILWWNAWTRSHAELDPKDPAALRRQAEALAARGHHLLPYTALQALSERADAYPGRAHAWRRQPFSKLVDEGTPYWIMCPATPWSDYFPRKVERLCRELRVNGLYYDFTFPYRCEAPHHPCGYRTPEGTRRGEFRVFALRQLAQETYERVKAVNPGARILMHTSAALMVPYISFADMMLNGEQLRQPLTKAGGHTMDVLPLAALRAEYRGRHAGLAPFLIPQLATPEGLPDPKLTADPALTNEMLALALLHDIGIWPIYCHAETVEVVRRAQRAFGMAAARFLPYWDAGGPAVSRDASVLASAWVKGGGALLVAANLGRAEFRGRLRLRGALAARSLSRVTDALTGQEIARRGATLTLTIPPRGFRLLRLHSGPAGLSSVSTAGAG